MTYPFHITAAGLVPFTTIDFPDRLAAVVFLQGCPLKCPFCHNPALQDVKAAAGVSLDEIETFLKTHQKRLDGIVLSGGEPLAQADVAVFAGWIKSFGYQVGLHTSGVYPARLKELLPVLDWVGLDVKAPWGKYDCLSGRSGITAAVKQSLALLADSGVSFEVRTTCDPRYLSVADIYTLAADLKPYGVQTYALQHYRTFLGDCNPPSAAQIDAFFNDKELNRFLKETFLQFLIR